MRADLIGKGKYRQYWRSDYFEKGVSRASPNDWKIALLLQFSILIILAWFYWGSEREISSDEKDIWIEIENVNVGNFFISKNMPLLIQTMAYISRKFFLAVEHWRKINDFMVAMFISDFYRLMRTSNVSTAFSLLLAILLTQVTLFQSLYHSLNMDIYAFQSILRIAILMRKWRCTRQFSLEWYKNLIAISILACFVLGAQLSGITIWLWLLIVSARYFWCLLGDLKISTKDIIWHFGFRAIFFVILPLSSLVLSYDSLLHCFTTSNRDSSYLSPGFQHYILHENMDQPKFIYYGSTVTMRHHDSFGGFLRGQDIPYPGSDENLVTVSHENDEDNEWIIEHVKPGIDVEGSDVVVKNSESIKLRHKKTGKLLRASEEKPPISEKEYDKRVSTTGDSEYLGNSDETWTINIRSPHSLREPLTPFVHLFSLRNRGRNCDLISHYIQLGEWAKNEQEVLCLDPATEDKTLLYFQSSSRYDPSSERIFEWPEAVPRWKLIAEYLFVQFQIKNTVNSSINEESELTSALNFLWPMKSSDGKIEMVLCGAVSISIVLHSLISIYSLLTYNIFEEKLVNRQVENFVKDDIKAEAFLAWLMYFYLFNSDEKFSADKYIPSLTFGLVLMTQYLLI